MSKEKKVVKKKVVKTSERKTKPSASSSRTRSSARNQDDQFPLLFNRRNYLYMLIGVGLIALGLILMLGGSMPSPDIWDESLIYSFRRTVLAPVVIIAGIVVEIYAIFK